MHRPRGDWEDLGPSDPLPGVLGSQSPTLWGPLPATLWCRDVTHDPSLPRTDRGHHRTRTRGDRTPPTPREDVPRPVAEVRTSPVKTQNPPRGTRVSGPTPKLYCVPSPHLHEIPPGPGSTCVRVSLLSRGLPESLDRSWTRAPDTAAPTCGPDTPVSQTRRMTPARVRKHSQVDLRGTGVGRTLRGPGHTGTIGPSPPVVGDSRRDLGCHDRRPGEAPRLYRRPQTESTSPPATPDPRRCKRLQTKDFPLLSSHAPPRSWIRDTLPLYRLRSEDHPGPTSQPQSEPERRPLKGPSPRR